MLKKYRQLIIGIIIGGLIFNLTPVFAKNVNINVVFDNLKIKVNGKLVNIEEEPFIYKGKTYVPLRAIAELLNKQVSFDPNTKEIKIDDNRTVSGNSSTENVFKDNSKYIYYDGNYIKNETNLPENAVITSTKLGIVYNGVEYYFARGLVDKNYLRISSDENNVYYSNIDKTKTVAIPYSDMENLDICIYLGGGHTKFFRADLLKDLLPRHLLE